jgi:general secretion pathway protein J
MKESEAGFTLLELLIATTLLALLSLVLFSGMRFGTRSWDRAESSTAGGNEIRRAQEAIADALGRAYPELQMKDPTDPHVYFDGRADRVTFLGPDRTIAGALAVFTVEREGSDLVMITTPELARDPARQTLRRVLLKDVASFALAYYGAIKQDDPPRWTPDWRDRMRLPGLVRVQATLAKPGAKSGAKSGPGWTEMIVEPRIAADVGCNFDAVTKFCQGR